MIDRHAEITLAPRPNSPRLAREFVSGMCLSWNATDFVEPGNLVVSELVTNAVTHAETDVRVDVTLSGDVLTVGVHDDAPGEPVIQPPSRHRLGGRGLAMVAAFAESWGVRRDRPGKTVWCRLTAPAGA